MPKLVLSLFAAVALVSAPVALAANADRGPVSATATFSGELIAVGMGYSWGNGVLTYEGRAHPFKAKGVSALGVGAQKMTGVAEVYHLRKLTDFNGIYGAAEAGGSFGKEGGGDAILKNDKGVEMRIHTRDRGIEVSLAVSGVDVTLSPQ